MTERSAPDSPPRAADVVGVPALPPGRVTHSANRVRALLGRVHAAMAPPPVRILEGLFGMLDHRVLVALCEIGVPDALTGPTNVADLAARLDADPPMLERLLRFGATRGWVRINRRGRVRPTRVTEFLREGHPGGWRAWVDFAGGHDVVGAVGALSAAAGARAPFEAANGAPFFDWMVEHRERGRTFDRAMEAGSRMHALVLAAALDWSGTHSVCDVGGGTGVLLATLLELVPGLSGLVFDLPEVVERAHERPGLEIRGGDAFARVPDGFDTYLLVNVLHDWSDDDATRLLVRVHDAAGPGSRIVVVDGDRPTVPRADVATSTDVLMAALTPGGKERSTVEFVRLGRSAGLAHQRSVRLASGDFAHVFRPRS